MARDLPDNTLEEVCVFKSNREREREFTLHTHSSSSPQMNAIHSLTSVTICHLLQGHIFFFYRPKVSGE